MYRGLNDEYWVPMYMANPERSRYDVSGKPVDGRDGRVFDVPGDSLFLQVEDDRGTGCGRFLVNGSIGWVYTRNLRAV